MAVPPLPFLLTSAPFSLPVHSLLLPSFLLAPFCMRRRRLVLFPVCVKHQVGGGRGRVVVKVVKRRKFGATCKKARIALSLSLSLSLSLIHLRGWDGN